MPDRDELDPGMGPDVGSEADCEVDRLVLDALGTIPSERIASMVRVAVGTDQVDPALGNASGRDGVSGDDGPAGSAEKRSTRVVDLIEPTGWDVVGRPDRSDGSHRWRHRAWATTAVAAALIAVLVISRAVSDDSIDSEQPAGPSGGSASSAPATTPLPPGVPEPGMESSIAGVQPDVTYDVAGEDDASPDLDRRLDTGTLLGPLGLAGDEIALPPLGLSRLPAVIRYQAFNQAQSPECVGFMSRPLTITGSWGRAMIGDRSRAAVMVLRFATLGNARDAFLGLSLEQGARAEECTGFARPYGVENWKVADVAYQAPPLPLPAALRYNSTQRALVGDPSGYTSAFSAIVRNATDVVVLSVHTSGTPPTAEQIATTLQDALTAIGT